MSDRIRIYGSRTKTNLIGLGSFMVVRLAHDEVQERQLKASGFSFVSVNVVCVFARKFGSGDLGMEWKGASLHRFKVTHLSDERKMYNSVQDLLRGGYAVSEFLAL